MFCTKRSSLSSVLIAGVAGTVITGSAALCGAATDPDAYSNLPSSIQLSATIRDFKAKSQTGGHKDFESMMGTTNVGLLSATLGSDGKPVPASLRGQKISTEYTNSANKNIMPASYDSSKGDHKGSLVSGETGNGFTSYDTFNQWYRDVAGVNVSKVISLTLNRQANSNRYVFDSATDEPYKSLGGFFPINGELYGNYANNSAGKMSNFHFTTEVETQFVYEKGKGAVFNFTGDDDVWVFIGGKLVIDLGGVHSKKAQTLELDRLTWLNDGQVYQLKVFHAERHTVESNFRIETTLKLRSVDPPTISGLYD